LEKWATLAKMCHTWQNAPYLEKRATFGEMQDTCKNVPTWKNAAQLEK